MRSDRYVEEVVRNSTFHMFVTNFRGLERRFPNGMAIAFESRRSLELVPMRGALGEEISRCLKIVTRKEREDNDQWDE